MPGGERNEFHIEFDFLRQGFEYHWDSSKRHRIWGDVRTSDMFEQYVFGIHGRHVWHDIGWTFELSLDDSNLWLEQDIYCLDIIQKRDDICEKNFYAVICFPESPENEIMNVVKSILQGISFIFLLLTLIVYVCLPVLQNLHGKTLMSHVASLMLGYLCLCVSPWLKDVKENTVFCSASGFLLLFSFLSAFSWLNVMCFDIWRTFGRFQGTFTRDRNHGKRFLLYCLYAWGLPMFITVLM